MDAHVDVKVSLEVVQYRVYVLYGPHLYSTYKVIFVVEEANFRKHTSFSR